MISLACSTSVGIPGAVTGTLRPRSRRGARRPLASVRQFSHQGAKVPEHPGIKALHARKKPSYIWCEARVSGRRLSRDMAHNSIKRDGQSVRQSNSGTQRRRLTSTLDTRNGLESQPSTLGQLCLGQASSDTVLPDSTRHVFRVEGHSLVHSRAAYGSASAESRSSWSSRWR
jgi:hypothetical protein